MSLGEKDSNQVLGFLADKGDYYTKLALIEKKRLADLTDALEHIRHETENYRSKAKVAAIAVMNQHAGRAVYKRADGADIGKQALSMTAKMLTLKEVQLNKLCQRKSEILNYNNNLKLEIDHYRRMRLQTDISHAKFDATLQQEKEKIEEWLAESAAVVERRENLVREKEKLEEINK
jgi:regulator of replication initiation timing